MRTRALNRNETPHFACFIFLPEDHYLLDDDYWQTYQEILLSTSRGINDPRHSARAKNIPIVECNARNYTFGPRGKYHRGFRGFARRAPPQCDFFREMKQAESRRENCSRVAIARVARTIKVLPVARLNNRIAKNERQFVSRVPLRSILLKSAIEMTHSYRLHRAITSRVMMIAH